DGTITPTCAPASGATFAIRTIPVTCTATDAHNNSATGTFTVTVQDTTPPALGALPANITTEATGPGGAKVTYTPPTATDTVDPSPAVTCAPASGSSFPPGDTAVSCTAKDASGNTTSGSFKVTVQDTTPPKVTVPANLGVDA